ncbi:uncharacterized protein DUF922 [Nonlabens dokdonensis]|jgi:hypothetical protein|uniref:Secreted protein n=2 Tax=Nonlabens dokdonensis TaxID=328515 RepID=L7WF05_NONDD|nr:DUF922 domain-containing protein [Nonlabens dokdonensis]AGC77468.1 secreted protein [Nonlabens dokdonensis DSW-6]PZX39971.1 uncharacterized protein DUF922 [Nonlabens dokdonensis]
MKLFFAFILVVLLFEGEPSERFTYQERPVLSWEDFKGVPPKNAIYRASVNSSLGYTFTSESTNGKLSVSVVVESYFYPQLSWKKNQNENNEALLKHEQLHWDISELYARKLRAAYQNYVPQKNPKKEVDFIFRKFEKERQVTQKSYDRETRHGTIKDAQSQWEIKIMEELFKTSEYTSKD